MIVLELQAEAILKEMTVDEMREAAKIGIMFTLALTGKGIKTINKIIEEEKKNGQRNDPQHPLFR